LTGGFGGVAGQASVAVGGVVVVVVALLALFGGVGWVALALLLCGRTALLVQHVLALFDRDAEGRRGVLLGEQAAGRRVSLGRNRLCEVGR
jgi:hypothetical protein